MTAWGRDIPSYVASRVARLFPAYWAAVLATGALLLLTGKAFKDVSPLQVLANLTMVQEPNGVEPVDGVYWTLWVEMRFYLLLGLLMLVGITRQRVIAFAVIWPVVGALAATNDANFVSELLIAHWAPYFAAGMLLYVVYREGWSLFLAFLVGGEVLLAMAHAGEYSGIIVRKTGGAANPLVAALVVAGCFALVALVTTTRLRTVHAAFLTTLGVMTYPLYLLHEYWGLLMIERLHDVVPKRLLLAMAVGSMLLLAYLVHRLVERPFAPRIRRAVEAGLRGPKKPEAATDTRAVQGTTSALSSSAVGDAQEGVLAGEPGGPMAEEPVPPLQDAPVASS
jgi:peptidoglycan/LPS O-acetylase OafA/YrhL